MRSFVKTSHMRSFVKIKSTRNGETTLSFTDKVNHATVPIFNVAKMSFNAIRENKILAKISEFTVVQLMAQFLIYPSSESRHQR